MNTQYSGANFLRRRARGESSINNEDFNVDHKTLALPKKELNTPAGPQYAEDDVIRSSSELLSHGLGIKKKHRIATIKFKKQRRYELPQTA